MTRKKEPPWYQAHTERLLVAMAAFYEALAELTKDASRYVRQHTGRPLPTAEDEQRHLDEVAHEAAEVGDDLAKLADELADAAREPVAPSVENT